MCSKTLINHPAEEAFERYVLNQSSESEVEALETHYLACENCVTRLEQVDLQIRGFKSALQDFHLEKTARAVAKQQSKATSWWSLAGLSSAAVLTLTAAAMLSFSPSNHQRVSPPAVVLTAYRGLESQILPKDRELHLTLNTEGLDQHTAEVSLLDSNGVELWRQCARIQNSVIAIDIPPIHTTGTHFVRLFSGVGTVDPLREYSINVQ